MATNSKTEKIIIGIDDEVKELKGAELEAFLAQRELDQTEFSLLEAEQTAKAEAKESAKSKLSALGLTEVEIAALIS